MSRTLALAVVLFVTSACGATSAGAKRPAPTPTASASVSGPLSQAPPAAACSATAPVPGCTMLGDPFGVPGSCHVTSGVLLAAHSNETKLSSFGFGAGPVYLSGQNSWYASGEEAEFLIDPAYSGAVHITAQPTGSGSSAPVFTGPEANGSVIDMPSGSDAPNWRYWDGQMSFTQAGCYVLNVRTASVTEAVTIYVHAGDPPPG